MSISNYTVSSVYTHDIHTHDIHPPYVTGQGDVTGQAVEIDAADWILYDMVPPGGSWMMGHWRIWLVNHHEITMKGGYGW